MSDQRAFVELTLRYGAFRDKHKTVVVPINEELTRELLEPVELSDSPISLLLASPGMWGGRGNAYTKREQTFKMRRAVAEEIAKAMVPALLEAFGVNDELDGYRLEGMSPEERAFHRRRGRNA